MPLILYVLDPEPLLFGLAALFAFAQACYFEAEGSEEAQFKQLVVVGVGHAAENFALGAEGFDRDRLRIMRRRDFPPCEHPAVRPGGARNAHAGRLVEALADQVVPYVEGKLLGLRPNADAWQQRCLLGASYSAGFALQVLLGRPCAFQHFILGSPSVCFNPELLDEVREKGSVATAAAGGVRVGVFVGQREREGVKDLPGNVHDKLVEGAEELVEALKGRGIHVDGVHEFPGEDHSTMKLTLVSRGLTWFARSQIV